MAVSCGATRVVRVLRTGQVAGRHHTSHNSQSHLEQCVAYSHLREGKDLEGNFEHKTKYFRELSLERAKRRWI